MKHLYALYFIALVLSACSHSGQDQYSESGLSMQPISTVPAEIIPKTEIASLPLDEPQQEILISGTPGLALKLLDAQSKTRNYVVSPLGVQYLTGILANIAGDNEQKLALIASVYSKEVDVKTINNINKILIQNLSALDLYCRVSTANICVYDQNTQMDGDIKSCLETSYQACTVPANMLSLSTVDRINDWASAHTNGNINNVLDRNKFMGGQAIIANAQYFSAPWLKEFDKAGKDSFYSTDPDKAEQIDFMVSTLQLLHKKTSEYESVVIPFGNGIYRMIIHLPSDGVKPVLSDLDISSFKPSIGTVSLPLADITTSIDLADVFKTGFGIDVHKIIAGSDSQTVPMKEMQQNCRINWDEKGTEAASASVSLFYEGDLEDIPDDHLPIVTFKADHPFYFFITTADTSVILYAGYFNNVN